MTKSFFAVLMAVFVCFAGGCRPTPLTPEDLYDQAQDAVFRYTAKEGTIHCTAFLFQTGHFITSAHCHEPDTQITLTAGNVSFKVTPVIVDKENDVMVLAVEENTSINRTRSFIRKLLPDFDLSWYKSADFRNAQNVTAFGFWGPVMAYGMTSQRGYIEYVQNGHIAATPMVGPGMSGGPLVNDDGQVIGITRAVIPYTFGEDEGHFHHDVSIFVPIGVVLEDVKRLKALKKASNYGN